MTTGCKWIFSRGIGEGQKQTPKIRKVIGEATQIPTPARTVTELDIGCQIAGDLDEVHTTTPTKIQTKARTRQVRTKTNT